MDRLSFKLAAILGFQLVLALILWAGGPDYNAFKAKEPLLVFDPAKVDRIEIAENGANSVALVKEDGKWVIPSSAGFPADAAKVSGLLTKLAGLKKGWPVATSADAARRFKVAEDAFERRILLKSGGGTAGEILLGTAPNFKSVSARASGSSNVYSVVFSAYEAGARGDDWMDRSLLNIEQDKIASIAIGDALLERKDGKFVLAGLTDGQKQDETATYRLVGALTYPVFEAVAGKGGEALAKVGAPDIEATVKRTSGDPIVLKYKKEAAGGAYLFASSANNFLFRISEASMEPIAKAKREVLIEAPKKAEPAPPAKAEDPGKAGEGAAQAAPEPVKPNEPKNALDQGGQATAEPVKAEERAQAVPPEVKQGEDERFKAAMQPPKPDEPKTSKDEGAQGAAQPAKAEEPKKAEEGMQAVTAGEPQKAAGEASPAPAPAAKPEEAKSGGPDGGQAVTQPAEPSEAPSH